MRAGHYQFLREIYITEHFSHTQVRPAVLGRAETQISITVLDGDYSFSLFACTWLTVTLQVGISYCRFGRFFCEADCRMRCHCNRNRVVNLLAPNSDSRSFRQARSREGCEIQNLPPGAQPRVATSTIHAFLFSQPR
jgi:hypothetical protein